MSGQSQDTSSSKRLVVLGAFGFLLIVAAVGALIYGVVLDPSVAGPVAGAMGVIAVAIVQRRWEKKQELERVRREQMAPIYERLVGILRESPGEEATSEFFKDLTTKMLLYGPTPIIKEWIEFRLRGLPPDGDPTNPTGLLNYERLLLLVRKDLGHDDSDLKLGDLLRVYVNDFDEMYLHWMAKQAITESQPSETGA